MREESKSESERRKAREKREHQKLEKIKILKNLNLKFRKKRNRSYNIVIKKELLFHALERIYIHCDEAISL